MPFRLTGLWRNTDFVKLWAGQTVSNFGTLMGAMQFTAVLLLEASPFQMGVLVALRTAPGFLFGPVAGVWVDRLPRKPVLVATDFGRALLFVSIPISFIMGNLRIEHLYVVALASSVLTIFFDVAYRSYLPSLVDRGSLVDANSKLTAAESFAEVTSFSIGGWIAQLVSAMAVVVVDAVSYLLSGLSIALIKGREPESNGRGDRNSIWLELVEGLRFLFGNRLLRPISIGVLGFGFSSGVYSTGILIFGIRDLGIPAGVLGTIFAVGGVSSIFGSIYAGRLTRRFGLGPIIVYGLVMYVLTMFLVPAAVGPILVVGLFLLAQQLGDGAYVVHEINQVSLRQAVTPERLLGRMNAGMRTIELGAMLAGSLIAGALGDVIGLRATLAIGATVALIAALWLVASPVRRLREVPAATAD